LLLRPTPGVDIHGQIQQRLLEAELGSSTTFHFANGPRTLVPDNNPTDILLTRLESSSPETRWQAAEQLARCSTMLPRFWVISVTRRRSPCCSRLLVNPMMR